MRFHPVSLLSLLVMVVHAQTAGRNIYFNFDNNDFSANGRWVPSNSKEKPAYPSEIELDCDRLNRSCTEATAEYYSGHPHVSISYLHIDRWDANGIVASDLQPICMFRTVTISFADKTVTGTWSAKVLNKDKAQACRTLGATGTNSERLILKNSTEWMSDPYGESLHKY